MEQWTCLDTGVRSAAQNIALDHLQLDLMNKEKIPITLRFLQFSPHAVLVGYHQCVEQEVRVDFCKEKGIDVNRRVTGGGAIFLDEPQLGWELIIPRHHPKLPKDVDDIYGKICGATVAGLRKLGLEAEFRPRNDIEVDGRKISGTGGTFEQNAFLFQGTLLTDFDVETMIRALMIPIEKLRPKELESVRERVTCLKWELGELPELVDIKNALKQGFSEIFDVQFVDRELTEEESTELERVVPGFESDDWVYGVRRPLEHRQVLMSIHKAPGGLIRVSLVADIPNRRIQAALITGDFFAYPQRLILDLEAMLKDAPMDMKWISSSVREFFDGRDAQIPGVTAQDFADAIDRAIQKVRYYELGIPLEEVNQVFTVIEPFENIVKPPVLLLPYCAKLQGCEYRHLNDCTVCGECTVGEAYEFAAEFGLEPITIVSFEDLMETLARLKEKGVESFIGSCCRAFYEKHFEDFTEAGMPGILVDIDSLTCYDLGREKDAYAGNFESQTHLRLGLLRKVLELKSSG